MGRKSARRVSDASAGLEERDLHADPAEQLRAWLGDATRARITEPTAMTLATAGVDARPSARIVLVKTVDDRGIVFFTNYESRKASDLETNPHAALVWYWGPLGRQVRAEGTVARVTPEESAAYFATRPRGSKIGAWVSRQSKVLTDRRELEEKVAEFEQQYRGKEIPLPPFWGGYRLVPHLFEFWQARESRLHDRFRYSRSGDRWVIDRLFP